MIGHLVRVSGPTAIAGGLDGVAINELVLVGEERLLGEVVRVDHDRATLQIYEETTGLALGEPAEPLGGPLAVELGPGLLGGIFDGLQRPLPALAELSGDFIARGMRMPGLDRARRWRFTPTVSVGDVIAGGQLIGHARAAAAPAVDPGGGPGEDRAEKVVAPPHAQGRVVAILEGADDRGLCITDPVLRLDDGSTLGLLHRWPVRGARPLRRRLPPDQPFLTGQRVLDGFFPVAAGGVAVVPGGFGSGKTILEQALARHAAADIIVYVGCGERGNEMAELLDEFRHLRDPRSGRALLERTVLVVNTSNMPVAAREASMYTGLTIAEYFRDLGHSVALMIDSTSRWAEALREISSRLEEMPGEEGYPTYLSTRLTQFYERAGRGELLGGGEGAVTIVGAVSPPGGDFSEPVTQGSLRAADALWALSSELAHRRHYPAVDWSLSFTLDADRLAPWFERAAGEGWGTLRIEAMRLLGKERELAEIAQLVGADALQDGERIVLESARLLREGFLRQNAFDPVDATTPPARMRWMLELLLHFHRRASDAIVAGVALRDIMAAGIGDRLLFLGQVAESEREAFDHAAREAIDGALDRLRAAT